MKKYLSLSFVIVVFTFLSCGNDKKKSEPEVIEVETAETSVEYNSGNIDVTFTDEKLAEVFKQYVQLKTALVKTNAERAGMQASKLMDVFVRIGANEAAVKATQDMMDSKDVEVQRTAFVTVTAEVEKMLQGAIAEGTIYKQHCPMAFGNTGASWLSERKEIYNPYFGDKMLKCGRVEAEIK
ncbi:MAG: DUF3347 domain-containing protein [Altibacter sp.]|uniref:DUF3347 domain-containing protein n=1 Tax=Altibacter sp. TaxID=2024823 RepID=UPI001D3A1C54|nr:DUF3347 domain-containing protein [Altibacter sp.]MBZ0327419.1 DUF3347 domain-containing protein [Altibacter sp.]